MQLRALRGVAPSARLAALGFVVRQTLQQRITRIRRRAKTGQVKVVERILGPRAANRYFWRAIGREPTWYDVERRISHLERFGSDARIHFVRETIDRTSDSAVIAGLVRHPRGTETLRQWLDEAAAHPSRLTDRVRRSPPVGGAIIGAGRHLLAPDDATRLELAIADSVDTPNANMYAVADSIGMRPTGGSSSGRPSNRVVITETTTDASAIGLLLPGCDRVTVLATAETFGPFDASPFRSWPGVGDVTVENIRTRIPRFSAVYAELHEATASIAERLAATVFSHDLLVDPADRRHLAVEIADHLFFESLRLHSVQTILQDPDIDNVVIALANQRVDSPYLDLIAGVDGLADDPRVELVSSARGNGSRLAFHRNVDRVLRPPPKPVPTSRVPDLAVRRWLDRHATEEAASRGGFRPSDRKRVLVVTTNNPAYNESTAEYVRTLRDTYEVRVLHLGRNATDLAGRLSGLGGASLDFMVPAVPSTGALADIVHTQLHPVAMELTAPTSPTERAAVRSATSGLESLVRQVVAPAIVRTHRAHRWFGQMASAGTGPDVVVLTPQRHPGVGSFAAVARRFGIPTVALEPHGQDANYSRYVKIAADYYGVMSDFFRTSTASGFDLDIGRIAAVGSPRQVTPTGYEPNEARARARGRFAARTGSRLPTDKVLLAFFGQPSAWGHVSAVWDHILDAAKVTDTIVLLKPHPEEAPSRVDHYLDQARERGVEDRVILLGGTAAEAIDLADIVATGYSTAAFDAAVRACPVVSVTDGDVRYPVDLPAAVGAWWVRSAVELTDLLLAFRADPTPFRQHAHELLEREPQFRTGPGPRLHCLVAEAIERGSSGVRHADDLPSSLFLDPPHPTFTV